MFYAYREKANHHGLAATPLFTGLLEGLVGIAEATLYARGLGEETFLQPLRKRIGALKSPAHEHPGVFVRNGLKGLVQYQGIHRVRPIPEPIEPQVPIPEESPLDALVPLDTAPADVSAEEPLESQQEGVSASLENRDEELNVSQPEEAYPPEMPMEPIPAEPDVGWWGNLIQRARNWFGNLFGNGQG